MPIDGPVDPSQENVERSVSTMEVSAILQTEFHGTIGREKVLAMIPENVVNILPMSHDPSEILRELDSSIAG
jgi:hypothetical protein